jgi:putative molybdopterin biosynthesis protein
LSRQEQFLDVIDLELARRRFFEAIRLAPLGEEFVALDAALGRVLSRDVSSPVNVPGFDRADFDGFAVRAHDTYGAEEERPRPLELAGAPIRPGPPTEAVIRPGEAIPVATGAMMPRGADAVVMVEHTHERGGQLLISKAVAPGWGVSFAASDVCEGEVVLRQGELLSSRDTGVLAAVGQSAVWAWRQPRVAVISTGDELVEPGGSLSVGQVYDSNSRIIADAVRELGAIPISLGIVPDDRSELQRRLGQGLESADAVILSGGTSKGAGDLSYRALKGLDPPGILVHGVALKPGKPVCLAASGKKPVVVLPGFPTSAIFTFHTFLAPVLLAYGGRSSIPQDQIDAQLAVKVQSQPGRTEFLLVSLVDGPRGPVAFPMGSGSGSVTTFSRADGFVSLGRHEEIVEFGSPVSVTLLAREQPLADLTAIGSHCTGLDWLLGRLAREGFRIKSLSVGSMAGLLAAKRGQCDVAGIHLMDPQSGIYNQPYLTPDLHWVRGYSRLQGLVYRPGDPRFEGREAVAAVNAVIRDPSVLMVNRNRGSGTRILIDRMLQGIQPPGYAAAVKTHHAVAAAVAQGRADWGLAIRQVADQAGLGFLPLGPEQYDFVLPVARMDRPASRRFMTLVADAETRRHLAEMGFHTEVA